MSFIVVDVESDGPIPGKYSMVSLGAVVVEPSLSKTFYGQFQPISEEWDPEALAISGHSREECWTFPEPHQTMTQFAEWIRANSQGRPIFVSDNVAYDWQFVNYYFHFFLGSNPFGFSGRRIGDIYCGMQKNVYSKWKHLRKTSHTHFPVDDAKGNAEALLKMQEMGLKADFK